MNLKQKLIDIKPSENSGSSTSNRFDYQKDWSLCKILELYKTEKDFVLTFEYHDDIIVLNRKDEPTKIKFYQIKTKSSSNWTTTQLIKVKKGAKKSMLGKLYQNKINFPSSTESLHFVSNAKFSIKLSSGEKSTDIDMLCCKELSDNEKIKIENALKTEHSISKKTLFDAMMFLEVDELTIKHHTELTRDRLAMFIEKELPDVEYKIAAIYKSIFDEIRIKSNYEEKLLTYEDLLEKKSISRDDFTEMLKSINTTENFKHIGKSIEDRLNVEKTSIGFMKSFRQNWRRLEIEKMDKSNLQLNKILSELETIVESLSDDELDSSLNDCLKNVREKYKTISENINFYQRRYLDVIIIYTIWTK